MNSIPKSDLSLSVEVSPLWGPIRPSVLPLWKFLYGRDDPLVFIEAMSRYLQPGHVVLEVGAGPGTIYPHSIRSKVTRLVGLDPDPRVIHNRQLDQGVVGECENVPFPDASFDVVFHRMVAEHFPDPLAATVEIARVLKPGGLFFMHTPNRLHYSMIAARVTPLWFHQIYMHRLGTRKDASDVHRAYYRMNTTRDIRRICREASLEVLHLRFINSPPGYLRFSALTFLAGALYQKTVEATVPWLRPGIILVAAKSAS
jgi:ubiquinone/menaquinone biosynthesis C-methylase UbiE